MSENVRSFLACLGLALCLLASAISWPMMKLGSLISGLDFTDTEYSQWVTSAFIIVEVAVVPVAGKIIDHIGLRRCVLFGTISFAGFSLLCTFATSMYEFAILRGLQGFGAAFLFASAFTAPGVLLPHGKRSTEHGFMTGAFAIGSLFGVAAGLYIGININWRYIFYIPAFAAVLGGCMSWYLLPYQKGIKPDFDFIGAITMCLALLFGMMYTQTVNRDFEMFSWQSAAFLFLIVLLVVALYHNEREAVNPVFPRSFRGIRLKIAISILLISAGILGLLQFYVKIYVLNFCDLTDVDSYPTYIYKGCGMFVFLLLGGAITALPGGHIVPHTGARIFCLFGFVLNALGLYLTANYVAESVAAMAVCLFVLGLGLGAMVTILLISLQGLTKKEDMGATSGFTMGMRVMAIAAGLSIYSDYSNRKMVEYIQHFHPDIGEPQSFIEIIEAILTAIDELLEGAVEVTIDSFINCASFAVLFCFVGFIVAYLAGTEDKGLCPPHEKRKRSKKKD